MNIELRPVQNDKDIASFLQFPIDLYKNEKHYVPQLMFEDKNLFNKEKEPFYNKGKVDSFIAYKKGKAVGRISCIVNNEHNQLHNEKTGFFGFFDCVNDDAVSEALLDKAKQYALENNMDTLRGPVNFSVSHTIGSLIKGFDLDPSLLTPYNFSYYNDLITAYGFEKVMDLYSYRFVKAQGIPEKLSRVANAMQERGKFEIKYVQKKDLKKVVKEIQDIYNDAWKENWGFLPLSDADIAGLAKELEPILEPNISYMVYDQGEAVACMITLPNINEALKNGNGKLFSLGFLRLLGVVLGLKKVKSIRTVIMGVKESHRKKGIEAIMIHKTIVEAQKLGYEEADLSWVLENNEMMNRQLEKMDADRYKEHRLYDLKL